MLGQFPARASVQVLSGGRQVYSWIYGLPWKTNDAGEFSIGVLPGDYEIVVTLDMDENRRQKANASVKAGQDFQRDFVFEDFPQTWIRGKVVSPSGLSTAGFRVTAREKQEGDEGEFLRETLTREDGSFALEMPMRPGARYRVCTSWPDPNDRNAPSDCEYVTPGGEEITLMLPDMGRVHFELFDSRTKEPIPQPVVCQRFAEKGLFEIAHLLTDELGKRSARFLAGRKYDFLVQAPGYRDKLFSAVQVNADGSNSISAFLDPGVEVNLDFEKEGLFDVVQRSHAVRLIPQHVEIGDVSIFVPIDRRLASLNLSPGVYRIEATLRSESEIEFSPEMIVVPDVERFEIVVRWRVLKDKE